MAKSFIVTSTELHEVAGYVCDHFEVSDKPLSIQITQKSNGTVPMLRTWRLWMESTAQWMANNGAKMPLTLDKEGNPYGSRPFNANDAHELFTYQFMPVGSNGVRKSWAITGDEYESREVASIGERLHAMEKMQAWGVERGINLYADDSAEFTKLKNQQCE